MIPLHRLPKRALDIVLKCMTTMNQLLISLSYKPFKSRIIFLTKGLKFKLRIMIGETFRIYVFSPDQGSLGLYFHTNESEDWSRKEGKPKRTFSGDDIVLMTHVDWTYGKRFGAKKSARQWILLLLEVFNLKKIETLKYESDDYNFDSIKETLRGLHVETLEITGEEAMGKYQKVLEAVPPSENFLQDSAPVGNYQNVLIQNFVSIDVVFHLDLPQLLIVNSKFANILGENFTIKHMNKFLKLWIKGSNSNAKWFFISWIPIFDDEQVEDVLKGIPHEIIPYNVGRSLSNVPDYVPEASGKIHGGYRIRRMVDGREATVLLEPLVGSFSLHLYVWDD